MLVMFFRGTSSQLRLQRRLCRKKSARRSSFAHGAPKRATSFEKYRSSKFPAIPPTTQPAIQGRHLKKVTALSLFDFILQNCILISGGTMSSTQSKTLSEEFELTEEEQRVRNLTRLNVYATDKELEAAFCDPRVIFGSAIFIIAVALLIWYLESTPIVQLP